MNDRKKYEEKVIQGTFNTKESITVRVYDDVVEITDRELVAGIVEDLGSLILYKPEWEKVSAFIEGIWKARKEELFNDILAELCGIMKMLEEDCSYKIVEEIDGVYKQVTELKKLCLYKE